MTSNVSTLPPRADRERPRFRWWWVAAGLAVVGLIAGVPRVFEGPATVDRVTVVNQTAFAVDVDVTGAREKGWTELGTAQPRTTTVMRDVVDQGDTWVVSFKGQGLDGGELRFGQADLQRSGWRIVISRSVGDRLAQQGATPEPPSDY